MFSVFLVTTATILGLASAAPTVSIRDGTIIGTTISNVENFMGIPHAQPPVASLRLRAPQPLQIPFGTTQATGPSPTACPQAPNPIIPRQGENCLNLNVNRPAGTTASSKLPVLVFLFFGGFIGGASSIMNGTYYVEQSIRLRQPLVFVAMNYRLNGFGFLAGKELQQEGNTNLGLKYQRLALQWVQNNIAAFGGDPTKGNSAGSISVLDQTIIKGGNITYNGKTLFRGAIMNSGSIFPALPVDSQRAQDVFNSVTELAGCNNAADKLGCLRQFSSDTFLSASLNGPGKLGYQSFDNAYPPRPDSSIPFFSRSPKDAIIAKKVPKIPTIIADVEDEGTSFVDSISATTTADVIAVFKKHFSAATMDNITNLVSAYPDDPAAGSSFRTGHNYDKFPQYKRLAAIYGDVSSTLLRRWYLAQINAQTSIWSTLSSCLYGSPIYNERGSYHGADVSLLQFLPGTVLHESLLTYLISFTAFSDPNKIPSTFPVWKKWTLASQQLLNISYTAVSHQLDDFRNDQYGIYCFHAASAKTLTAAMLDRYHMHARTESHTLCGTGFCERAIVLERLDI